MMAFRPKYITFDCYGTLINFHMSPMTRAMFADRLVPDNLQGHCQINEKTMQNCQNT
jgi:2-haloacid dehalogenase